MKDIVIEGVVRGKKPKTTIPDKALPSPLDKVNRQFHAPAPNVLWVSDVTYVATWPGVHLGRLCHRCICPPDCRFGGQAALPVPVLPRMPWNRPFINAGGPNSLLAAAAKVLLQH